MTTVGIGFTIIHECINLLIYISYFALQISSVFIDLCYLNIHIFRQMVATCLNLNSSYMIMSCFAYIPKLIIVYIFAD